MHPSPAALDHLDRALGPLRALSGGPRWTDRERWHVTLGFLGETDQSHVHRLLSTFESLAAEQRRLRLRLAGGGTFPARGSPRVLWVGVVGGENDLHRLGTLARAVRRAARAAGIAMERRPFHPHLTLGRWRPADPADRAVASGLADYAGPPFTVAEIALMRSYPGPAPRYEPVAGWRLTSPGG